MAQAKDSGSTMQHIFNKSLAKDSSVPQYDNPATSGLTQDLLRQANDYSENNPEPPSMKSGD